MNKLAAIIKTLDLNMLETCYNGKADRCCCGCSGTYSETDRSKKLMLSAIVKGLEAGTLTLERAAELSGGIKHDVNSNHICFRTNNERWKILYFTNDGKGAAAIQFKTEFFTACDQ
jgi:hypothetical protein